MTIVSKFHDCFGNRAEIARTELYAYKGAAQKQLAYIVSLFSESDDDFMYFRDTFTSYQDARQEMTRFSLNKWVIDTTRL